MTQTLDLAAVRAAVADAVRAPSLHNSQPWRFRVQNSAIQVLADPGRTLPVADPTGWGTRIACGAATFNLRLAFVAMDLEAQVHWRPFPDRPEVMSEVIVGTRRLATSSERRLHAAIPRRHSNRLPFWPDPVPAQARAELLEAASAEFAWLELLTGPLPVGIVGEIAQAANRVLLRDDAYRAEIHAWSGVGADRADGVPTSAGGPTSEPQDLFPGRPFGGAAPRAPGRDFEAEPLVGVLGTSGDSPTDELVAGAALQRVLLTITDLGLAASMFSQPIEVPAAREQLRVALGRRGSPQMVLRIGYGQPGATTPRRSVDDVLDPPPA
jgi:nitroreductase